MKARIIDNPTPPVFEPVTIGVTFESQKEIDDLYWELTKTGRVPTYQQREIREAMVKYRTDIY